MLQEIVYLHYLKDVSEPWAPLSRPLGVLLCCASLSRHMEPRHLYGIFHLKIFYKSEELDTDAFEGNQKRL